MKTLQIANAKTRFFNSKEEYLKFRQAWKDFHNSDKLTWREDVEVYSWAEDKKVIMKNVKHTSLSAEHYLMYNLLRGYPAHRGFAPTIKTEPEYKSFWLTLDRLKWQTRYFLPSRIEADRIEREKELMSKEKNPCRGLGHLYQEYRDTLMRPFGDLSPLLIAELHRIITEYLEEVGEADYHDMDRLMRKEDWASRSYS